MHHQQGCVFTWQCVRATRITSVAAVVITIPVLLVAKRPQAVNGIRPVNQVHEPQYRRGGAVNKIVIHFRRRAHRMMKKRLLLAPKLKSV